MPSYYNEIEPFAAQWLRNLIAAGHIAPGDVDERSIVDVRPSELAGYTQCHFFAGIGGWSLALRRAGWPDDRPIWTGSCPCQPWSVAGSVWARNKGEEDERDLWPVWYELIRARRPCVVFGEQVSSRAALRWIDRLCDDLERSDYAIRAVIAEAAAFGSPQRRERVYFAADAYGEGGEGPLPTASPCETRSRGWCGEEDLRAVSDRPFGAGACWPQPLLRSLDDGLPGRMGLLHGLGNAIDARPAEAFIRAYLECRP